ncbi:Uncharacterized protein FKW44_017906 [Caligus rogercresseyi]|uniref:Calnexin n=1 Tax=Caligus rogercresseyi TaxID=217165 RepID=A0A7T8GTN5_CALRO|nr:Uncharacterized protein FKW44_017906 [Caligus rogercresseyi]
MFGPDKCGSDAKLHFIFRHANPLNGTITEKHAKKLETKERTNFEETLKDKRPHLYRLTVHPDSTYEISVDYKILNHGSLLQDFEPPRKIPDPEAFKPADWDEDQPRQILDSAAVKPDGWMDDEAETIPDPSAEKPQDWDEEMDGEWEAALVDNPACTSAPGCGVWKRQMASPTHQQPNYKGKWKPRKIPNPNYFHDPEPFTSMAPLGAVGIELWSMSEDIYFDNILVTDRKDLADSWAGETFDLKVQKLDANDAGLFRRILTYSNRNPWLYAVYVVLVGLPLVLIVTFCCSVSKKEEVVDSKKTDSVTADDEEEEIEEEEEPHGVEEVEEEEAKQEEEVDDESVPLVERKASLRKRRARKE